jgi:O-antigen/teichoic acid export membrane protein
MLNNLRSVAKSSVIYGMGNLSTKLIGFILIPFYTSHFKPYFYGIISIVDVSSQALISIFNLGLYYALFRWYWDKEYLDHQKSIFYTSFVFLVFVAVALFAIFYPFRQYFSEILFNSNQYVYLFELMVISSALQILTLMPATLMRLQEKPVLYTVTNLGRLILSLILTIYFIAYLDRGLEGIFEAQVIGHIFYLLVIPVYMIRNIDFKFRFDLLKGMLKFGSPIVVASISGIIIMLADRYGLKFLGDNGLADTGTYSLGYKIANTITVFVITSINLAVSPMIYKMMDDPGNKRFYSKIMTYTTFIVVMFVIAFSIYGKEIVKILSKNPEYWNAYKVVPLISFAILFFMMKENAVLGLNIMKKTRTIAVILILISILNVSLNLLLIPLFNTIGAAISYLLSQFVCFILIYIASQKIYFIPYELKKIFKMIILSVILISASYLLNDFNIVTRLVMKTILLALFPVILYFIGFYEKIEIERINGFFNKWSKILFFKNRR